jgi:hypothetical protein
LLTVLFVALKLTGHIDWSWWWVLSPLWIGLTLFVMLLGVLGIILVMMDRRDDKKHYPKMYRRGKKL